MRTSFLFTEKEKNMIRVITCDMLVAFEKHLYMDEKSENTILKYMRDINALNTFAQKKEITKPLLIDYKQKLKERYKIAGANSIIGAINCFLKFAGWEDLRIKQFKVQKRTFYTEEQELTKTEYMRLLQAAERNGKIRLSLLIQALCSTGIRISELKYLTVEAVHEGKMIVSCKNKTRTVFIVSKLRKKLLRYIKQKGIQSGCVFVTASGKPINRSNVWREMKSICKEAGVSESKVYPHNLRHLFARVFYSLERDIVKLADILGHSNIGTTRIYVITTGAEHKRKMEAMRLII